MKAMIKFCSLISMGFLALACGSEQVSGSEPQDYPWSNAPGQESSITNLNVNPVNAGVNPDAFALEIQGEVMLGTNPCMAQGRTAWLQEQRRGRNIVVTPMVRVPLASLARLCTMEYAPVFVPVALTVRGFHAQVDDVIVRHVDSMDNEVSALALAASQDTIIGELSVQKSQEDLAAGQFAVLVQGQVLKGGNPCQAANTEVRLVSAIKGDSMHIKAVARVIEAQRICTLEYNPQFVKVEGVFRGSYGEINHLVIEHVEDMNRSYNADSYLSPE